MTYLVIDAIVASEGLVGATAAAEILGIARPNFCRYRDRLTAIPVAGSRDVYLAEEVRQLAVELRADRSTGSRSA